MLAFQDGDEDAFTQLVESYQGAVFSMLRRILGPNAAIEDLAQESFLRLWKSRDRYQPSGRFTTFLFRITYNLALNRIRDNKRKPLYSMPRNAEGAEMEFPNPLSPAPEEASSGKDWARLVQRGLGELPENQRAALVFQHYDGLELQEIGKILGCSPQAAKSLVHRARVNLRDYLSPYREAEHD